MTGKLVIVMGVSGSGKSTLARSIADRLGFPFIDGDDHHPRNNIEKMSRGEALDDQDRLPWLCHLREVGIRKVEEEVRRRGGQSGEMIALGEEVGVVLVCSSLKGFHRQILRGKFKVEHDREVASLGGTAYQLQEVDSETSPPPPQTRFVWIKGDKETLKDRLSKRQNHFFKPELLDSQFEALEPPEGEPDVVVVPLGPSTQEQTEIALEGLRANDSSTHDPKQCT